MCYFVSLGFSRQEYWSSLPFPSPVDHVLSELSTMTHSSCVDLSSESASGSVMSDSLQPHGLYSPWNSPGLNTGECSLPLLHGIFPTQGSNPGVPHCSQILYQLSHKGSSKILEWVAYPFSRGSSWTRSWTGVSCTAGGFFTNWAIREVLLQVIWN